MATEKPGPEELKRRFLALMGDMLTLAGVAPDDAHLPPGDHIRGVWGEPTLVILTNPVTRKAEVRYPVLGYVSSWSRDDGEKGFQFARGETVATRPTFRDSFKCRRCIFPAGSYLIKASGGESYRLSLRSGRRMGSAGIWDYRRGSERKPHASACMITMPAGDLVSPISDRMPAILRPEEYRAWLDPERWDPRDLQPLLRSYPSDELVLSLIPERQRTRERGR